ncbi:RpiB/LacA/LacB family sugar-phosphate isomerase [Anaerolentibacter hominis]|uniref:RpiB/LacA/LacB family sugar-phosphate isomerase n=1 Tax=Anaerolentibacter hominis TaxID=3079009 RepID=UPI0031B82405
MKIALVMEWSQSEKNELVYNTLKDIAEAKGHTVDNYGQYNLKDHRMTYNQAAILISTLLNSGAADFVVTGCGTGEGATLAANAMPGVTCGHVVDPSDTYLFTQINAGNCVALPFAKGFGWGGELNLKYMFEKLFEQEPGGGYPPEAAESEKNNARILNELKAVSHTDIKYILKNADRELVRASFGGPNTLDLFYKNCKDQSIADVVKEVMA